MKLFSKRIKICLSLIALSIALLQSFNASANNGINFWGNYPTKSFAQQDVTKPVPDRSYFTTSVEPTKDGAKLTVEIYHGRLNSPVTIGLQVAVNDGAGVVKTATFMVLDDKLADNPKLYYSKREYNLSYDQLNQELQKILPSGASHLKIGPGSPLFAVAHFTDYDHMWGSTERGGIFFMPEKASGTLAPQASLGPIRRPTELDLAIPISQTMGFNYNKMNEPGTPGLKVGGQIRSRMESEGKFQVPVEQLPNIRKQLFDMANDPALAEKILGADWSLKAELRYMRKDANGQMIVDKDGFPTPDPMVDTYYDNANYDAAKKDMAVRYRWTEGNATGSWNFKPGLNFASPDGIVDRIEFAVDTTDDKPDTLKKFANSMDPLNPFKLIRDVVPGSQPSDFLQPAVKISDNRYKFKLQHKNGLVIEMSLDYVEASSLRDAGKKTHFGQLEMDVEHLATKSMNVVNGIISTYSYKDEVTVKPLQQRFRGASLSQDAFLDGRPVIHTEADVQPGSPVKTAHANDMKLAAGAVVALRDTLLGKNWIPGAQKNAYASVALGLVSEQNASKSVKETLRLEKETKIKSRAALCPTAFGN